MPAEPAHYPPFVCSVYFVVSLVCYTCSLLRRLSPATISHNTPKPSTLKPMRVVQLGTLVFSASRRMVMGLRSSVWSIGDWLEEAGAIFVDVAAGPQIVIGSSTGAHIALLLLRRLIASRPDAAQRIRGMVLIAPAWDLTEELMWKTFSEEVRREIMEKGFTIRPSAYDAEGYRITRLFIEEGRNHLLARRPFDPGRPVVILQGLQDEDVPASHARELLGFIEGGWGEMIEVADGDHRLSRPQDLALLFAAVERLSGEKGP